MWTQSINLRKITEFKNQRQIDQLLVEKQTQLFLNEKLITKISHTPQFEKELAIGYLIMNQLMGIKIESIKSEDNSVYVTSNSNPLTIRRNETCKKPLKEIIFKQTAFFQQAAVLFKKTAITESAGFANDSDLIISTEDLTQNNALYKLVGSYITQYVDFDFKLITLLLSAKLDLILIKKIALLGIAIVVTRTAPTKQALDFASYHNITVVGFARGKRFNWYTT